jgi:ABC-type nitrate/sulfonate/bicarbonate transport system substrate-binding protein
VLRKYGLDPVKDVIILQIGTQPSRIQALSAGSIQATIVSPPLDYQAKKQGFNILVNVAELKIPYPQLVVETTEKYVREQPQTAKNFLKGFIEGLHYVASHKEETKKIMTKHLKTTDPEILEITYQSFLRSTDYSLQPSPEGIRNAIEEVAGRVPAAKNKKPEEFVDLKLLQELQREGFFKQFERKA